MSEESYIGMFYPERFISLEGNVVSEIAPHSDLLIHEQRELVRWMIYWDGVQSLQLFGVTKDGLAILQNRVEIQGKTKRTALKYAKKLMPYASSDEWSHCPFLVYTGSRYSYKHECDFVYQVFWNGHSRFMLGMGDEYYDEEDVETSWFSHEVGGYVTVDYDDDWGYLDNPGSEQEVPGTRSDYADAPDGLISSSESLVDYEARNLDIASVSEAFDDLAESGVGGCIAGLLTLIFGMISVVAKFALYGLIGLIILNFINYFTGWFDDTGPEDISPLFMISAIGLWGFKALAELAWNEFKERRNV